MFKKLFFWQASQPLTPRHAAGSACQSYCSKEPIKNLLNAISSNAILLSLHDRSCNHRFKSLEEASSRFFQHSRQSVFHRRKLVWCRKLHTEWHQEISSHNWTSVFSSNLNCEIDNQRLAGRWKAKTCVVMKFYRWHPGKRSPVLLEGGSRWNQERSSCEWE